MTVCWLIIRRIGKGRSSHAPVAVDGVDGARETRYARLVMIMLLVRVACYKVTAGNS
jgi:hypothetical protein